jgi:hypothetical protein
MAILLLNAKGHTRWRGNLKSFLQERGWVKSGENLGAAPFKRNLSIYTAPAWSISLNSPFDKEKG